MAYATVTPAIVFLHNGMTWHDQGTSPGHDRLTAVQHKHTFDCTIQLRCEIVNTVNPLHIGFGWGCCDFWVRAGFRWCSFLPAFLPPIRSIVVPRNIAMRPVTFSFVFASP